MASRRVASGVHGGSQRRIADARRARRLRQQRASTSGATSAYLLPVQLQRLDGAAASTTTAAAAGAAAVSVHAHVQQFARLLREA